MRAESHKLIIMPVVRPVGVEQQAIWNRFDSHAIDDHFWPIGEWPMSHQRAMMQPNAGGNSGRYFLFMFFVCNGVMPTMAADWVGYGKRLDRDAREQLRWLTWHWHRMVARHRFWDMIERSWARAGTQVEALE